jgi:hypothetical protein
MKKYFILMMAFSALLAVCGFFLKDVPAIKSNVSFVNRSWHSIHLQVRIGQNADASQDRLVFDKFLLRGQKLTLKATEPQILLYRRDANPDHADGRHFTEWTAANCDGGNCVISNL